MKKNTIHFGLLGALLFAGIIQSCKEAKKEATPVTVPEIEKELAFEQRKIVDSAKFWWAHTPADVTGDGIADLLFINNNSAGGYLGYYKGKTETGPWELNIIAEKPVTGGLFAGGDLEANDIDGDGDMDVIAIKHPGEWTDAGATAELFWYENTGSEWKSHTIGTVPDAVKDVSFADFDIDGKMDLAILTFDEHTLSVFRQNNADSWERVQYIQDEVLHEGMAVGNMDNDSYPDIVATGLVYYNPGVDLTKEWRVENLNEMWNNQEGDWSRNGTKTFATDVDKDGRVEIYMAHSERAGYPLVAYKKMNNEWQSRTIKDSIPACHTLQVYDFDLDGDYDVLAGINYGRAINLNKTNFDVSIFLNEGNYSDYKEMVIEKNGIYNGQAIDYDGDGDIDIFRYPNHEATDFYILENTLKQ
ncbi:VCBS repeat-containing protein [Flavobacteriaceae bacterium TP-CH-4]|uniref:VCBS repeat-containing protein n=1 Tax=Pelagihabitans pacificus TaxID=2696054 RepID=A0A967AXV9_9FLAO|nr:VCBS repeat-containing protein [Pelagihabitans pacificus]NHF61120.1 VCBS repeat-containing protein [Pelagihabitans pacificus]